MSVKIYSSIIEAVRDKEDGDGLHYYGLNGQTILAKTLAEARDALTDGLKRLTRDEVIAQLIVETKGAKPDEDTSAG